MSDSSIQIPETLGARSALLIGESLSFSESQVNQLVGVHEQTINLLLRFWATTKEHDDAS